MPKLESVIEYLFLLKRKNIEEAFTHKLTFLPESLFKFRSLDNFTFDCLEKNSVWLSSAKNQNDPFECSLTYLDKEFALSIYKNPNFKDEFKKYYKEEISQAEINQIINAYNPELEFRKVCKTKNIKRNYNDETFFRKALMDDVSTKFKKDIVMSSFSERNDSILMWSHYSNYHKGICIEYEFKNEKQILEVLEPVYYSNELVKLTSDSEPLTESHLVRIAAITKAMDWQYEREWRIVFPSSKNGHYKMPKPKAVYLGARFKENKDDTKEKLLSICKNNDIKILEMKIHESEYKIVKKEK